MLIAFQDKIIPVNKLECAGRVIDLSRVAIMGILNITPDSFSDGGHFLSIDRALAHAQAMVEAGADIIDVGGESTRPGAPAVSQQEELDRVLPVIERLQQAFDITISIDTSKPAVMRAAVAAGAGMINDVQALQADGALTTVAALRVPVSLMHMQGEPRTMQGNPVYEDVSREVVDFLAQRVEAAVKAGINRERLLIDPGFGFGKTLIHNLDLLRKLDHLRTLDLPILVGLSRKSMIGKALGLGVEQRLAASLALALIAIQRGARIIRVHDVSEHVQAVRMAEMVYASD